MDHVADLIACYPTLSPCTESAAQATSMRTCAFRSAKNLLDRGSGGNAGDADQNHRRIGEGLR